jgi:dihydrofolate reductase
MGKLNAFIMISIDGCFADAKGDMSFAHAGKEDREYQEWVAGNAKGGGMLLFGRRTYDLMVQYWPTPVAAENNPVVAKAMNESSKVVFSSTMESASWQNTKLVKGDIANEVRKLKAEGTKDMTILGSGSIVAQLTDAGLIDIYTVVVLPVVLGAGKRIFTGIAHPHTLSLTKTRAFANGKVVSYFETAQ